MFEAKENRRTRMLMLATEAGSLEALAEKTDTSARHLSQIKNRWKGRGMGRAIARRIEERLGKPLGWMDQPLPQAGPLGVREPAKHYRLELKTQSRILDLFDQLTRAQQERFLNDIGSTVEDNAAIVREIRTPPKETGDDK